MSNWAQVLFIDYFQRLASTMNNLRTLARKPHYISNAAKYIAFRIYSSLRRKSEPYGRDQNNSHFYDWNLKKVEFSVCCLPGHLWSL